MSNTWDGIQNPIRFTDDYGVATQKINDNYGLIKDSFDEHEGRINDLYNPNLLINGGFQVWQRGLVFNNITTGQYVADRFRLDPSVSGDVNISKQACTGAEIDITGSENFLRLETNTAADFVQLEALSELEILANKPLTISFYAKVQAGTFSNLQVDFVRNYGSGGSAENSSTFNLSGDITTTWQRFTVNIPAFSLSGKILGTNPYSYFRFINRQAEQWNLDITSVKLELGSVATPFVPKPYQEESKNCKYYFERLSNEATDDLVANGFFEDTTSFRALLQYSKKRVTPTLTFSDFSHFIIDSSTGMTLTSLLPAVITSQSCRAVGTGTGGISGNGGHLRMISANAYIDIDAEI